MLYCVLSLPPASLSLTLPPSLSHTLSIPLSIHLFLSLSLSSLSLSLSLSFSLSLSLSPPPSLPPTPDDRLDGYQKKKYVCKLLFIFLLGNDVDFGHQEAVNLLSSTRFSEKQIVRWYYCGVWVF